ncbi:MAG: C69 family dipeptidase [Leptospira sp.]|nr:C69 family dipeptidase [Leptospira sp.]
MCDTSFASEKFTRNNLRIFAKNSDREPNESQEILHVPNQTFPKNSLLRTTYIEIPQVERTYEIFLSKPFQMWGAEMGVNEYGVCIGNEAVFTNIKKKKANDGLTGMDMIRLALERSKTAKEALGTITKLLELYGQDANGGYENQNFFYHNSFIIADETQAYVLETADKYWVAKAIDVYYAISNGLTITNDFDICSDSVTDLKKDFYKKNPNQTFSFQRLFSDTFYTTMSFCKVRRSLNTSRSEKAKNEKGQYSIEDAFNVIRSHTNSNESNYKIQNGNMKSICVHATGPITPNSTTGSLVVVWNTEAQNKNSFQVFYTGTTNPCLSVFKPFFFNTETFKENKKLKPGAKKNESLWWNQEKILRRANFNYVEVKKIIGDRLIKLETQILERLAKVNSLSDKNKFQEEALNSHYSLQIEIINELESKKIGTSNWFSPLFQLYWKIQNSKAGIKL